MMDGWDGWDGWMDGMVFTLWRIVTNEQQAQVKQISEGRRVKRS